MERCGGLRFLVVVRLLKELDSQWGVRIQAMEPRGASRRLLSVFAHSGDVFIVGPVLALIWLLGDQWLRTLSLVLIAGSILAVLFIYVIKFSVRRSRPPGEWGAFYRRADPYSFPSGHAAKTMTIALIVLTQGSYGVGAPLLLWSLAVGFARVALGVHYLSDVTVGYLVGIFVGIAVSCLAFAIGVFV
jgi:undecaprenyl-diphosphatase